MAVVRALKGLDGGVSPGARQVRDRAGRVVGGLRAIDAQLARDDGLAADLTRWRAANADMFLSVFQPSVERTRAWLAGTVLGEDSRLMFLVEDASGRRVGQYGLRGICAESAELDNGIRGEPGGHPQLFYYVELAMIHFCLDTLRTARVITRAFSENYLALRLHQAVGMVERAVEPVVQQVEAGAAVERRMTVMEMSAEAFYAKHGWVRENR